MKSYKQYLSEKLIKNPIYDYHMNPTTSELIGLIKKWKSVRGILIDNDLYVWDGYDYGHHSFVKDVLKFNDENIIKYLTKGKYQEGHAKNRLNIDINDDDEGCIIGINISKHPRYGSIISRAIDYIMKDKHLKKYQRDSGGIWDKNDVDSFQLIPEGYLTEKVIRGKNIVYHVNPTASQIIQFTKNCKENDSRLMEYKDSLYMWDAYYYEHNTFLEEVLGIKFTDMSFKEREYYDTMKSRILMHFNSKNDEYPISSVCGTGVYKKFKRTLDQICEWKLIDDHYYSGKLVQ